LIVESIRTAVSDSGYNFCGRRGDRLYIGK
jgi:hypothetical protein